MNKKEITKNIAGLIREEAGYNFKLSKLIDKHYSKHLKRITKKELQEELMIAEMERDNAKEQYESAKEDVKLNDVNGENND